MLTYYFSPVSLSPPIWLSLCGNSWSGTQTTTYSWMTRRQNQTQLFIFSNAIAVIFHKKENRPPEVAHRWKCDCIGRRTVLTSSPQSHGSWSKVHVQYQLLSFLVNILASNKHAVIIPLLHNNREALLHKLCDEWSNQHLQLQNLLRYNHFKTRNTIIFCNLLHVYPG